MNVKTISLLVATYFVALPSLSAQDPKDLIPKPTSMVEHSGFFTVDQSTQITASSSDPGLVNAANQLNLILNLHLGYSLKITDLPSSTGGIRLILDPSVVHAEGYTMVVDRKKIEIRGRSANGLFYGVQTLRQLLPLNKPSTASIPALEIKDEPRFQWRGMHLDVGRHFFSKDEVLKYLDYLAMYKINTFHWHLTEDQGWRIEIKKYPKLTTVGGYRAQVGFVRNQAIGLNVDNGKPYGGFYTQEDIKEVVAYALKRHITIIPEIEMPGHSLAAMFSYPELCCFPNDIKEFKEGHVTTDIYCAGKEESFVFLENVLKEVFALFPSKYIHIGGDEAFKDKWKKCPRCQKRMQDEGLKNEDELQSWFIRRMEKFINANGKSLIGWDEILDGGLAPNATVMAWRGERGAVEAARLGNDAVNATAWPLYFSDGQNSDERAPGNPGGNSLMKVYEYNPMPNGLTEQEQKHILGAQGCLWSEFTPRFEHIEHQLFPRICALSEIIWSKPDKDWWGFYNRVAQHENLLRQYKINYSQRRSYIVESKREINPKKKGIHLALTKEVKEPIYYTLDGTTPTKDSKVYQKPLFLNQTTTVKACVFDQAGKTDRVNTNFYRSHQAIALKVNCGEAFKDINVSALTDGQLETSIQFEAKDLDFTIDLGKVKLVKSLSTTFKEVTFKRFFLPETAAFMVSADGVNYETVATYASPTLPENRKIYNSKGEMSGKVGKPIRYVRLLAKNPGLVQGKSTITGQLTKVLLDEIVVD